ncbi:MAG TPA: hypothetical protein VJU17_04335 [Gemmatimonadales bacterium]|nr:hypothetical protein [Gemmatimonadales bacterium]
MTRARLCLWTGTLLVIGCSSHPSARDARSQRARDSAIGASNLPGAQGVRGALRADDSAAARNARLDSVANDQ